MVYGRLGEIGECPTPQWRVLEGVICVTNHASWYPGPRGFSWFFFQKETASREAATLHTFGTLCWSEVQNIWFLFHCHAVINLKIYLIPSLPPLVWFLLPVFPSKLRCVPIFPVIPLSAPYHPSPSKRERILIMYQRLCHCDSAARSYYS